MRDALDPPDARREARGAAPRARRYRAEALDWPLLHWLLRCPFLRAVDLALFSGLSGSTTTRRLEDLERWGLVEWVAPACLTRSGAQRLYYLSNAGTLAVAAALGTDAATLARTWGADELRLLTLLPLLPHLVRVQALVGGILAGAPLALGEQGREARGGWHWVRDYTHRFSYRERPYRVRVDAALALHVTRIRARGGMSVANGERGSGKVGGDESGDVRWERQDRWHAAFVLADARVQDWSAAARTLDTLLSYREAAERWPVYPAFPSVLLLAEDERHAEQWRALTRDVADVRHLPPLAGVIAVIPRPPRLEACEPLDPWRLPWHDLATGAPVRLAAVLSPLLCAAIPPGVDGRGAPSPLVDPRRVIVAPHPGPRVTCGAFSVRAAAAASRGTQSSNGNGGADDAARRAESRLLTLRLGGRLLQALELLFCAPGIRVADLADLFGVQLPSMDRYLSELDHHGLVRRVGREAPNDDVVFVTSADMSRDDTADASHLSFGADTTVRLSTDGQRLVTMTQGISARSRLARRAGRLKARRGAGRDGNANGNANQSAGEGVGSEGKVEGRPHHATHDAGVFHFFALLARAAANENRRRGAEEMRQHTHRLAWWEVGTVAERRYRYHGSWHNLRPDGAGLYEAGRTRFRFWLEWDRGSMNLENLTRKFATYASYLASGEWRETSDRVVPHLVVVVQSLGQLQRMRRAAADASAAVPSLAGGPASDGHLCASITLASRLEEAGPLASIWWPLLPDAPSPVRASSLPSEGGNPSLLSPRRIFP
jgi:hypothetical protein